MNDTSDPTARNAPSSGTPQPTQEHDEWRVWRPFLLGLGGLVFMLVVISVSI